MRDEKLRDLMRRMAAMSPEPPPYPEGMKTVEAPRKRRSGAVVFAVTGLAVIALALPFLLSAIDPDVDAGATTVPTATTDPVSTTAPEATSTTLPGDRVSVEWPIFLVQEPGNSRTGNPGLVAFYLSLAPGTNPSVLDSIRAPEDILFGLADLSLVIPQGFRTVIPPNVKIVEKSFQSTPAGLTRLILDMNREFLAGAGGLLADLTMLNQIIYTAQQFGVDEILFTVDGEPIEAFGLEGLSLEDPVNTGTFIGELNPIFVTEPITIDANGVVTVRGWANVFEATVSYNVIAQGVIQRSGHATASCGTGCWGNFEILIDLGDLPGEGRLEIFEASAQDGSVTNRITIPIPDGIWTAPN